MKLERSCTKKIKASNEEEEASMKIITSIFKLAILIFILQPFGNCQLTWTPIYVGKESQVDLWTKSEKGCQCSFNSSKTACACCVRGGCSCGPSLPNRCTQCGLENYCANMCNVTLVSKDLLMKSDRAFGQIKSPQLQGPTTCVYRFVPDTGQRVELQVWRMISVGKYNGTMCEGGWLQFAGGPRICGQDMRLGQPILLFSDSALPILHMKINEKTERSQVYAFYSFASTASTTVGLHSRGGKRVSNTDCDWVYEETNCQKDCVLASPGYPGLYPPNSRCRYLITSNAVVSIILNFTSLVMPLTHCTSDYVAIYAGPTANSALLRTMCGNRTGIVNHVGKDLLVEFRSGPEVSPFDYNGFVAVLNFVQVASNVLATTATTAQQIEVTRATDFGNVISHRDNEDYHHHGKEFLSSEACDIEVNGDRVRVSSYTTKGKSKSSKTCRLGLQGRDYDTVHVHLTSYHLSLDSCRSHIEVYENLADPKNLSSTKLIGKVCGPDSDFHKHKSSSEENSQGKRFSSKTQDMTILLNRGKEEDFMDVFYYFHNERESGTQKPKTICEVEYYGLTSHQKGTVTHPEKSRYKPFEGNDFKCKQHFIPAANQVVVLTLNNAMNHTQDSQCTTLCGDSGCRCQSSESLMKIDHLLVVSETRNTLACLCGNNQDWLPIEFWSSIPVYIEWSVTNDEMFNLTVDYKFMDETFCGNHDVRNLEGEIHVGFNHTFDYALNRYYQQKCTYVIDSPRNRELIVQMMSTQNRPCHAWNLTIYEYNKTNQNPVGPRLFTFCARDALKNFTIAPSISSVVVKLETLGRTAPQYIMRWWKRTNEMKVRKSLPSPNNVLEATSQSAIGVQISNTLFLFLLILLLNIRYHNGPT